MLDRVSTSAFANSEPFKQAIRDFGAGSLRWPNAGHDNLLITHWDNDHTIYYSGGDYTTTAAGNIWDPLYDTNHAAPRTELINLDAFVDVLKATKADPLMLFTWRSAELWRDIGGTNVFYRDPEPFRMDGSIMPQPEADMLSSREQQYLENNRMLKEYYALGGPDYPVVQIGGEVFIGWDAGQEPWVLYGEDKGDWIASTLRDYFQDLSAYARSLGKHLRLMAQFKEANSGGHEIPTPVPFLRGEFDKLLSSTGDIMTYYGCSMHYRHAYLNWLEQADMTWAFIVDGGEGTAQEIQDWMRDYTAAAGYPGIELIPHANQLGSANESLIPNDYTLFKRGLVNTQFLMELIEAGFPYACHYGGIKGDYTGAVGLKNAESVSYTDWTDTYVYNPVLYASGLIGDAIMNTNGRPARLIGLDLASGNADGKTQVMVIESSSGQGQLQANGGPLSPDITQVLYAYVLNKRDAVQTVALDFDQPVQSQFEVKRYAEGAEETAPIIAPASSAVVRDGSETSIIHVTAAPFSMTRVRVYVEGAAATTNHPPQFNAPILFAQPAKAGTAYTSSIADEAFDADGDALTFFQTAGPAWLATATNGLLSGTPSSGDLGLANVFLSVTDGMETNEAVLRILVTTNPPPAFTASPIHLPDAEPDKSYSDTLSGYVTDDGETITFTKLFGPGWLTVSSNGVVSGTPASADAGWNQLGVEVADENGGTDRAIVELLVGGQPDLSGFVGWDSGSAGAADYATLAGFAGLLTGGANGNKDTTTDGTWGSQTNTPAPSVSGYSLKVVSDDTVTITVSNATGFELGLEGLFFDYNRPFSGSPATVSVEYSGGNLEDAPGTPCCSCSNHVQAAWTNHDIFFGDWLEDVTLADGETASFSLTFNDADAASTRGDLDNIMVRVGNAPPLLTPYEEWAADHRLTYGPFGDDDGDGLKNLAEFGLAGNPTNAGDVGIAPMILSPAANIQYVYLRRATGSGLTYHLELTDDLVSGSWTNAGYTETGTGFIDPEFETVTNEIPIAGKTNQFIRLFIGLE